jgi:hypothetical protein
MARAATRSGTTRCRWPALRDHIDHEPANSDLEETAEGLRVTIRRSKTDQEGHGHVIAIPHGVIACPVAALKAWLEAAAITEGAVFRPIAMGGRIRQRD